MEAVRVRQRVFVRDPIVEREPVQLVRILERHLSRAARWRSIDEPAQDLEQPRPHPLRIAQGAEGLKGLEVGFLDEVLRRRGVPGEPEGQPEQRPRGAVS